MVSFWSRHFGQHRNDVAPKEIVYPTDIDLKRPVPSPIRLQKRLSIAKTGSGDIISPWERLQHLQKPRRKSGRGFKRTREAVKFRPLDVESLSSSDDERDDNDTHGASSVSHAELSRVERSSSRADSSVTLTNHELRKVPLDGNLANAMSAEKGDTIAIHDGVKAVKDDTLDYSDFEEDVASTIMGPTGLPKSSMWSPAFLRRHSVQSSEVQSHRPSMTPQRAANNNSSHIDASSTLRFSPIPATPSLIRAIDRLAVAQQAAYDPLPPLVREQERGHNIDHAVGARHPQWQAFWHDVKMKAGHRVGQ